jgi:hypothetical protein
LYDFRDRLEPFLKSWNKQLIDWAKAEGITSATRGSLDGSFVASLASRHQLMSVRRVDRRLLLLRLLVARDEQPDQADGAGQRQALEELLGPQGTLPAWVPPSIAGRKRVLRRYEQAQQRLAEKLRPYQQKEKLSKKDQEAVKRLKVSVTDPEAALGWDKAGTFRPLYNVPLVQATDAPLTLAFDVLARNNDDGLLRPMMEKTKEQVGRHLEEVLVDGAFVSVGDVVWCVKEGITVYAPPSKSGAAKAEVAKAEGKKEEAAKAEGEKAANRPEDNGRARSPAAKDDGPKDDPDKAAKPPEPTGPAKQQEKFAKEAFRYDREEKVYFCPQGKRLEEAFRTTETRTSGLELPVIVHRASGQDCSTCAQHKRCTSNPKKGRVVKRYEGEEALERLRERMAEPASQAVYKERGRSVELGYADVKEHRGLRVFRCFGIKRARAQAGLVILASNGLKIMATLQRRRNAHQSPSGLQKQPA